MVENQNKELINTFLTTAYLHIREVEGYNTYYSHKAHRV